MPGAPPPCPCKLSEDNGTPLPCPNLSKLFLKPHSLQSRLSGVGCCCPVRRGTTGGGGRAGETAWDIVSSVFRTRLVRKPSIRRASWGWYAEFHHCAMPKPCPSAPWTESPAPGLPVEPPAQSTGILVSYPCYAPLREQRPIFHQRKRRSV